MNTDIIALCALIDAGDDTALLPLADAMEEAGDGRVNGMRRIASGVSQGSKPARCGPASTDGWGWAYGPTYPTRSAAFLALAEALTS